MFSICMLYREAYIVFKSRECHQPENSYVADNTHGDFLVGVAFNYLLASYIMFLAALIKHILHLAITDLEFEIINKLDLASTDVLINYISCAV